MTATPDTPRDDDVVATDELVRRAGVTPLTSFDDVAPQHDPFESDGEYADFRAGRPPTRTVGCRWTCRYSDHRSRRE